MANKKSNEESQNKSWVKYVIIGAIVVLFVPVFALVGYQKYLDKADAERFATLQSDFKKLQTEFNKIDPGWEYGEGCTAPHFASGDGQPICFAELTNRSIQELSDQHVKAAEEQLGNLNEKSLQNSDTFKVIDRDGFDAKWKGYCSIEALPDKREARVRCASESRSFYFDRTDR